MTSQQQHHRISELFLAVCELPAEQRTAVLDDRCGDDPALRREVEVLLARDAEESAFLGSPALGEGFSVQPAADRVEPDRTLVGSRINQYLLTSVIASGGMGTVYEAEQDEPRRTLAVKVMKRGIASSSALKRFEYESQILAHLNHPGIAHVYEAGHCTEFGDVPYFAMELIADAKPITTYAKDHELGTRARLELFSKVCDAVHHGHQKGVIHRDLKPSNILVDAEGQPKIIDFGVARATDSDLAVTTLQTDVGQLIGTLQYMSPEQCEANVHELDTRTDVYSLGVVLYELLCDQAPYDVSSGTIPQAIRVIREQTPTPPSTINKTLRGDLETITLKAMEKDKTRRYDSATELEADIRRYLNDEPIVARPASAMYQFSKFARRNRALVAAAVLVLFAMVGATAVSSAFAVREKAARATSEQKNLGLAAVNEFMGGIFQTATPDQAKGRVVTVREALDEASKRIDEQFDDTPLVEATVRTTMGSAYTSLGQYEDAIEHYEQAHRIRARELGANHPDTASALQGKAQALAFAGRSPEAIEHLHHVIAILTSAHGEAHADVVRAKTVMVLAMLTGEQYHDAEPFARQVLAQAHLVDTGWRHVALNNLGKVLMRQGEFDEAVEILQALYDEIVTNEEGESDPDETAPQGITMIINNLGQCLVEVGLYDEGERHLLRAVKIANNVFGPDNDFTLRYTNNYAGLLMKRERFDDAEQLYLDVFERRDRVMGAAHPHTLATCQDLVELYDAWGKPAEASSWRAKLPDDADDGDEDDGGG